MSRDSNSRPSAPHPAAPNADPAAGDTDVPVGDRARRALEHGEWETALTLARTALQESYSSREALFVMAELALRAKNRALAEKVLNDLLRKNPTDLRAKRLSQQVAGTAVRIRSTENQSPRKHVLLFTDDPGLGGVAQYNHAVLCALADADFQVTCVQTESENPLVREQREKGVSHRWLDFDTGREFARTQVDNHRAVRIFTESRPDLILFSDCCPFSNMAARDAAMRLGIPYILVVGFVGAYLARDFPKIIPTLVPQHGWAKQVVAVSEENLALLRDLFGTLPANSGVIHYGRPARFFFAPSLAVRSRLRAELKLGKDDVVSFTAARLTGVKGFRLQLAALNALRTRGLAANLHLVWAGDGEQREKLAAEIGDLGLGDRVHLLGQRWDVADWYDAADIFCLPSFVEGMPLAIMEAMAKGLPVVATSVSGIPEELGDTGKLLPNPETEADKVVTELAQTWAAWSADSALRREKGRACRARAVQMFREELMVEKTLGAIKAAISADPGIAPVRRSDGWVGAGGPADEAWQAQFYLRRGMQGEALAAATSALRRDPKVTAALMVLGKMALERGGWDQAEAMFRRANEIKPRVPEIEANLAESLIAQGKVPEAKSILKGALTRFPSESRLRLLLDRASAETPATPLAATA